VINRSSLRYRLPECAQGCRFRLTQSLSLRRASARGETPALQTVGDIRGVAWSAAEPVIEVAVVGGPAVVEARSGIEGLRIRVAELRLRLADELLEPGAGGGPGSAIGDHLVDLGLWARRDAGAGTAAVVGLHEARVDDAVVGGGHAHAALALLHHDGQNEALVDAGGAGHLLDGALDAGDLTRRVVGAPGVPPAGVRHGGGIGRPEVVPGAPDGHVRPSSTVRTVTSVEGVAVGNGRGRSDL
jgi:hypothetical protein